MIKYFLVPRERGNAQLLCINYTKIVFQFTLSTYFV